MTNIEDMKDITCKIHNKISFMKFVKENFKSVPKLEEEILENIYSNHSINEPLKYIFEKSFVKLSDGSKDSNLREIFNTNLNWTTQYRRLLFDSRMDLERIHHNWKRIVHIAESKNIPIIFEDIEIKKLKINFEGNK